MIPSTSAAKPRPESGFTLIELMLYMGLSVIVFAVVVGMLTNSGRAQSEVDGVTKASNAGQLIIRAVQTGVRNASQVSLTASGGTQLLMVRTAGGQTPVQWTCQAWYFTPNAGGTLYTLRTPATGPLPPPTPGTLSSWSVLGTGISVSGAQVFTASAGLVTVSLNINAGSATPISLNSTSNTLNLVTTGSPCF
jgi:type II secretory pathway pseudopilin PulG